MTGERADAGEGGDPADRLRAARRSDPLAPELVNLLAFFAPEPLPVAEISRLADRVPGRLSSDETTPTRVRTVLGNLADRGPLIRQDGGIRMTSELQAAAREDLVRPQAAGYADAALRILEGMDEDADGANGGGGRDLRVEVILPHAPAVAEHLAALGRAPDRALVLAARALEAAADAEDAGVTEVAERLVEIARSSGRLRDPFLLAALLDQLGELRASRGRDAGALAALREAVDVARDACSPEDPRRAVVLHNAGDLARRLDRPGDAARLLEECLGLLETAGQDADSLRARAQLDLAEALLAAGDASGAGRAAAGATSACRRRLGARHPETAAAWSLWGRALRRSGRRPAAAACFRRALAALEETYGGSHPALGPDLGNLAEVLEAMGRRSAARDLHRRARDIFREAYGPEHRLTRAAARRTKAT